jgi:hypothetical protein
MSAIALDPYAVSVNPLNFSTFASRILGYSPGTRQRPVAGPVGPARPRPIRDTGCPARPRTGRSRATRRGRVAMPEARRRARSRRVGRRRASAGQAGAYVRVCPTRDDVARRVGRVVSRQPSSALTNLTRSVTTTCGGHRERSPQSIRRTRVQSDCDHHANRKP